MCSATVRNLGIIIDSALLWRAHANHVTRSCFGILIGLLNAKHLLPTSVLPRIIDSRVLSHIRYCVQVFENADKNVLEVLQCLTLLHMLYLDDGNMTILLMS